MLRSGNGILTIQEITNAINGENTETEVQKYLRSLNCPVLKNLASGDPKKTSKAFKKIDKNKKYVSRIIYKCSVHLLALLYYYNFLS